jgi:hypothetical protein
VAQSGSSLRRTNSVAFGAKRTSTSGAKEHESNWGILPSHQSRPQPPGPTTPSQPFFPLTRWKDYWSGVSVKKPDVTMIEARNHGPLIYTEKLYRKGRLKDVIVSKCQYARTGL